MPNGVLGFQLVQIIQRITRFSILIKKNKSEGVLMHLNCNKYLYIRSYNQVKRETIYKPQQHHRMNNF